MTRCPRVARVKIGQPDSIADCMGSEYNYYADVVTVQHERDTMF